MEGLSHVHFHLVPRMTDLRGPKMDELAIKVGQLL